MIYIYTQDMCSACIDLKAKYDAGGIEYIERDGGRLKTPAEDRDSIDVDAFVQLSINNMAFPVEVNV